MQIILYPNNEAEVNTTFDNLKPGIESNLEPVKLFVSSASYSPPSFWSLSIWRWTTLPFTSSVTWLFRQHCASSFDCTLQRGKFQSIFHSAPNGEYPFSGQPRFGVFRSTDGHLLHFKSCWLCFRCVASTTWTNRKHQICFHSDCSFRIFSHLLHFICSLPGSSIYPSRGRHMCATIPFLYWMKGPIHLK